jgi:hypothetical protein
MSLIHGVQGTGGGTGEPSVPFFWVAELTKKGWPHLHIIVLHRNFINKREIAELWSEYGMGNIVDLKNRNKRWRETRAVGLAFYLSKYLVKQLTRPDHFAFRRWSSSHGFLIPRPRKRAHKAGFSSASVAVHRAERSRAGAHIVDTAEGFRWEKEVTQWTQDGIRFVRPPGLTFDERLALTSSSTTQSGIVVPDSVRRGIRWSRRLGFDWTGVLSNASSIEISER